MLSIDFGTMILIVIIWVLFYFYIVAIFTIIVLKHQYSNQRIVKHFISITCIDGGVENRIVSAITN